MKKFISALSSLAIAATAMGGTMANAATNDAVSADTPLILDIQSNGANTYKIASGEGGTVPVTVYIPQNPGVYDLQLFFQINDGEPGKGSLKDRKGNPVTDKSVLDAVSVGNYGLTMSGSDDAWGDLSICFSSGFDSNSKKQAGYFNEGGVSMIIPASFAMGYTAVPAYNKGHNVDSYSAWEAAGKPSYTDYTPVTAWDKSEAWSMEHPFVTFDIVVPAGTADGDYVLDLCLEEKYNTAASALFDDDNNLKNKSEWSTVQTSAKGLDASGNKVSRKIETVPLTITVGEGGTVGTTAPVATTNSSQQTAATTAQSEGSKTVATVSDNEFDMVYDLVPSGKDYEAIAKNGVGNNVYHATAGEVLNVEFRVRDDAGTAGIQMHFDFSQIVTGGGKINVDDCSDEEGDYRANPTCKYDNPADITYVFAQANEEKPLDDGLIFMYNITVPEADGTYTIDMNRSAINKVVPKQQDHPYNFIFHGLDIVVGEQVQTSVSSAATTASSAATTASSAATTASSAATTASSAATTASSAATTASSQATGSKLIGDVNCSGDVRIDDVVLLNRYLAGTKKPSDQGIINADANVDNTVNSDDSTEIKEYLARINLATTKVGTAG